MTKVLQESRSLYEQDILLWVEDTVAKLKAGDFQNIETILDCDFWQAEN